jgi:hypothetical protein
LHPSKETLQSNFRMRIMTIVYVQLSSNRNLRAVFLVRASFLHSIMLPSLFLLLFTYSQVHTFGHFSPLPPSLNLFLLPAFSSRQVLFCLYH